MGEIKQLVYVVGSMRNPQVPMLAKQLRVDGFDVFDDWYSPGPQADDKWQEYEKARGRSYEEALEGWHAKNVFAFDDFNLNRAHAGVLVYPAGKSGHLELGKLAGRGIPTWILADGQPKRYDIMTQFATQGIYYSTETLITSLKKFSWPKYTYIVNIALHEAMWLAGILEGEGSFICDNINTKVSLRPRISMCTTDEDVARKVAKLLDTRVYGPYKKLKPRKPVWSCAVTGLKAGEYMRVLKPYMGIRRQAKIQEILNQWNPQNYRRWRYRKI